MQASRSARQPAGCALLSWCVTEHLTLTVRAQPHASNLNSDSQATVEKGNNSVWLCLLCRVYRITMRKLNRHAGLQEVMGSPLAGEDLTAANQAIWAHSAAHTHRCWAHSATHPLRWLMDIATQGSSVQPTHKGGRQVCRFAHVLLAGRQVGQGPQKHCSHVYGTTTPVPGVYGRLQQVSMGRHPGLLSVDTNSTGYTHSEGPHCMSQSLRHCCTTSHSLKCRVPPVQAVMFA